MLDAAVKGFAKLIQHIHYAHVTLQSIKSFAARSLFVSLSGAWGIVDAKVWKSTWELNS